MPNYKRKVLLPDGRVREVNLTPKEIEMRGPKKSGRILDANENTQPTPKTATKSKE